ncbi:MULTISPECIES: ATP-binding cassette domain-containing protein [unclassified Paludibacterium]|uniref:ATP-binding cassette domain-containing protein n=1 Tax=unclassified Paludibacterium TaxID=2618429 RepID=UPI001C04C547|nr:ATP-binding cassette domain-containing protein [Paludibacterium sp. B53371]BEV71936.1 heme ABC transporter ATP-binding protein [Paludibacterium sp. THUN1379]
MDTLLQLQHCRLAQGQQSFGPFSLAIGPGERVAILGPSGAGKSTLLHAMAGDLPPQSGSILLAGRPLASWSLPALSRRRAVLPQSTRVAFALTVEQVIALGRLGREDGLTGQFVAAAAALAACGHLLGRSIDSLSGGEAARVHLARLFAQLWDIRQGLILVDEPLSALDPGLQHLLSRQLDRFARERGHALLAVLHDLNHAVRHFDRLLLLRAGQLVGDVPTRALDQTLLQALYGLPFSRAHTDSGQAVWLPAA